MIIAVLLVSIFAFLPKENQTPAIINVNNTGVLSPTNQPTPSAANKPDVISDLGKILNNVATGVTEAIAPPKGPGVIESAQTIDKTVWKAVGANAWNYFQPDVGVDSSNGLPSAGLGWPFFTDWDLGVYIQAVMDANRTGLIGKDGEWGSISRLNKTLTFLENRTLNNYGYPFWFYDATTGDNAPQYSDKMTFHVDTVDTGRLLVALNNLKDFNPEWKDRINNFVYNKSGNRSDYAALVPDMKNVNDSGIYTYFVISGFASFWPSQLGVVPDRILNNIIHADTVSTYNVSLPKAEILCDPLLLSLFELKNNSPQIKKLTDLFYLAHESRYNETKQYVAFSEGNSGSNGFIYEWVVLPDGRTWNVTDIYRNELKDFNPIIYTKVAISFLALYNTSFARNMTVYLEKSLPEPSSGYSDGADYTEQIDGRILVSQVGSNTNGLILEAASYFIQNNQ